MTEEFTKKQQIQDKGYDIPYHYAYTNKDVMGILYYSYLHRMMEIIAKLKPARLLDGGCGDARLFSYMKENGVEVSQHMEGLDFSEAALRFAKVYCPDITFAVADLKQMPYEDNSFDAIVMVEVVEHIFPDELTDVLRECGRVLKPGGTLLLSTPTVRERPLIKSHYQHFSVESMTSYLNNAGLEVVTMEGNHKDSFFQRRMQKLFRNSFYELKYSRALHLYRWCFRKFWAQCDITKGRRMIVQAKPK